MLIDELLFQVAELATQAGKATLTYWRNSVAVEHKQDNSPVTAADLAANQILIEGLTKLTPDIPILSEEASNIDLTIRQTWNRWWLVDPLDGTKEFIAGNEDFTVNIALIDQGNVIFGVVVIPATNLCYIGGKDIGAWRLDNLENKQTLHCRIPNNDPLFVVASRRHGSEKQQLLLNNLQKLMPISLKNAGSSLKFCLIAEGNADCYPRFAPTCQWDTAAAQGVLEGAGGSVFDEHGQTLSYYPKTDYLNPNFIALGNTNTLKESIFNIIEQLPN